MKKNKTDVLSKTVSSLMLSATVLPLVASTTNVLADTNDDNSKDVQTPELQSLAQEKAIKAKLLENDTKAKLASQEAEWQRMQKQNANEQKVAQPQVASQQLQQTQIRPASVAQPQIAPQITGNAVNNVLNDVKPNIGSTNISNPIAPVAPVMPVEPVMPVVNASTSVFRKVAVQSEGKEVTTNFADLDAKLDEVIKAAKEAGLEVIEKPVKTVTALDNQINDIKATIESDYNQQITKIKSETQKYVDQVEEFDKANSDYATKKAQYDKDKAAYDKEKAEYDKAMGQYTDDKAQYDKDLEEYNQKSPQYESQLKDYEAKKAQYDKDKAQYDKDKIQYDKDKTEYDKKLAKYNTDKEAYDKAVAEGGQSTELDPSKPITTADVQQGLKLSREANNGTVRADIIQQTKNVHPAAVRGPGLWQEGWGPKGTYSAFEFNGFDVNDPGRLPTKEEVENTSITVEYKNIKGSTYITSAGKVIEIGKIVRKFDGFTAVPESATNPSQPTLWIFDNPTMGIGYYNIASVNVHDTLYDKEGNVINLEKGNAYYTMSSLNAVYGATMDDIAAPGVHGIEKAEALQNAEVYALKGSSVTNHNGVLYADKTNEPGYINANTTWPDKKNSWDKADSENFYYGSGVLAVHGSEFSFRFSADYTGNGTKKWTSPNRGATAVWAAITTDIPQTPDHKPSVVLPPEPVKPTPPVEPKEPTAPTPPKDVPVKPEEPKEPKKPSTPPTPPTPPTIVHPSAIPVNVQRYEVKEVVLTPTKTAENTETGEDAANKAVLKGDKITYRVTQPVLKQGDEKTLYTEFELRDELPAEVKTEGNVKVVGLDKDGNQTDVSSLFDISTNGQTVIATAKEAELKNKDSKFYDLNITAYSLVIPTIVIKELGKDEVNFKNIASTNVNGTDYDTNEVPDNIPGVDEEKHWTDGENVTDNKTYLAGDHAEATITADLIDQSKALNKLKSLAIVDDYSLFAQYVTFDKASTQVIENGKDVTSEYDITDNGKQVTATRKDASKAPAGKVKLIVGWTISKDTPTNTKFKNKANYVVNGQILTTNEPEINIFRPDVEKHWQDTTTGEVTDDKYYFPGDIVDTKISGTLPEPKDLAKPLEDITVTDDFSQFAKFVNTPKATDVSIVDKEGKDRTSEFDITVDGTKITAKSKDAKSFNSSEIFMKIKWTITKETPADTTLTNKGTLYLNDLIVETNQPSIHVYRPTPEKNWVGEDRDNVTNDKAYIAGDDVHAQVSVKLPKIGEKADGKDVVLAGNLKNVQVIDDYSNFAKYVSEPKTADVIVYENGKVATTDYTIEIKDNKVIATRKDASKTPSEAEVILDITWTVKADTPNNTKFTNAGNLILNDLETPTKKPTIEILRPTTSKHWTSKDGKVVTDDKYYVSGDLVYTRITSPLPDKSKLAEKINKLEVIDDYTQFAKYVEDVKAEDVFVEENGKNVTSEYTITVDAAKHTITATRKDPSAVPDGNVVLGVNWKIKKDTPNNTMFTNAAKLTVNHLTIDSNKPNIYVYRPAPEKNWTDKGKDGKTIIVNDKTYLPNDVIQATVSSKLPDKDKLAEQLTSVVLTDNYSSFAQSVKTKSVKVIENGKDVTGEYAITDKDGIVKATRKNAATTPSGNVQLVVEWTVNKEVKTGTTLVNEGSLNINDVTVDTEKPKIEIFRPTTEKHWTNQDGTEIKDGATYIVGDLVHTRIKNTLPDKEKLGKELTKVIVTDDYSQFAKWVDVKLSDVHILENGMDATSEYTLSKGKNKIIATRKDASKAPSGEVIMAIDWTIIKSTPNDTHLINLGTLQVNDFITETEKPEIKVFRPTPEKHWTDKDAEGNKVVVDGKTYVAGDVVEGTVSSDLPDQKVLGEKLKHIAITDDYSDFGKLVSVPKAEDVKVFENGQDVTSLYDITIDEATYRVTATRKDASTTPTGKLELAVKWTLNKDIVNNTLLTNAGELELNNNVIETNKPDINIYTPTPDKHWNDIKDRTKITDGQVYFAGDDAQATVTLKLPKKEDLANKLTNVTVYDDYSQFAKIVDWKETRVLENGADVTDQYEITKPSADTNWVVTAVRKNPNDAPNGQVQLVTTWSIKDSARTGDMLVNKAGGRINNNEVPTNEPEITIYRPAPVKHWTDKDKTVDNGKFIAGATVKSIISGNVPDPKNTSRDITKVQITDDFSEMKDFVKVAKVTLLENGKDVTNSYNVVEKDAKITATRKNMEGLVAGNLQLVVDWTVNKDVKDGVKLHNKGNMIVNDMEVPTNEPDIFIYHPTPKKDVDLGYVTNNPEGTINGKTISRGTQLTYSLYSEKTLAADRVDDVTSLRFEDVLPDGTKYTGYKANITIDGKNLDVTNMFKATIKGQKVVFTATDELFKLLNNDKTKAQVLPIISLYATVDKDGIDIKNTYDLYINNLKETSNEVVNHTPKITPTKKVLNENGVDINEKQVARGDKLNYQMIWDLSDMANMVYTKDQIAKGLSYFDDFSESDVTALKDLLNVRSQKTGKSVMSELEVKWDDAKGAFTLVAKDPEQFLKNHAGDKLVIDFFVKVNKDAKHTEFTNTAVQNNFGNEYHTNTVINRIPKISPKKDVVIDNKSTQSLNNKEVALNQVFDYKLSTSERPANYGGVTNEWSIIDKLDLKHDQFTGNWNVFAEYAFTLKDGTKVNKGDDITKYFTMKYDATTGEIVISAKADFLEIMNLPENTKTKQAWSAFIQMKRIKDGTVYNIFDESYNGEIVKSNKVKTTTPPEKPVKPALLKTNENQKLAASSLLAAAAGIGLIGLAGASKRKKKLD